MINLNITIDEIQRNAEQADSEILHMKLKQMVESGEVETYLDALCNYMKDNNINIDENINNLISPPLRNILYREALNGYMLKERPLDNSIEDFF